ncbi:TetR/AcrR family transcriptional regulator, partial [Xanthomonas perforans]
MRRRATGVMHEPAHGACRREHAPWHGPAPLQRMHNPGSVYCRPPPR